MEKEFVNYEIALILKEIGFDEPCFNYYDGNKNKNSINLGNGYVTKYMVSDNFTIAPLYQQAFRWFREKYGLLYNIDETYKKSSEYIYSIGYGWSDAFESYEEAEFECLKKLIEIVKEKK
jgi:hypothetical protein